MKQVHANNKLGYIILIASILGFLLFLGGFLIGSEEISIYVKYLMLIMGCSPLAFQLYFWVNILLKRKNKEEVTVWVATYLSTLLSYTLSFFTISNLSYVALPNYMKVVYSTSAYTSCVSAIICWGMIYKNIKEYVTA